MDAVKAYDVLGASAHGTPFNNMIKALQMCTILNTAADEERLRAALWVRRNRAAYDAECKRRREKRR